MAIATGMPEHSTYALDFIKAIKWIKNNLPGVRTSGGVSNLSFSFRGKNRIREILHSVFLYHAINAGLDMAIINPASDMNYEEIEPDIKDIAERLILAKDDRAESEILEMVIKEDLVEVNPTKSHEDAKLPLLIEEILIDDMLRGNISKIREDIIKALDHYDSPMTIIDGPLMEGMKKVGELFGEGKMYLPQVVKTARTMSRAIEVLNPLIKPSQKDVNNKKSAAKIVIATVKGDVHDIGKNIVATVLECNNYEVIDLGVMVPPGKIVDTVKKENPDIVCLSGLITPSLSEMIDVAKAFEKEGIQIPIIVGGAATSKLYTALRISPVYSSIIVHASDASQNPIIVSKLISEKKQEYIGNLKREYDKIRKQHKLKTIDIIPYEKCLEVASTHDYNNFYTKIPEYPIGSILINYLNLEDVLPFINWKMFFHSWGIHGSFLENFSEDLEKISIKDCKNRKSRSMTEKEKEAFNLFISAQDLIKELRRDKIFDGKYAIKFEEAYSDKENIYLGNFKLPMLRQQKEGSDFLSLSDFLESKRRKKDYIGIFAVTSGKNLSNLMNEAKARGDNYRSLLLQSLSDRIAEASSEWLHLQIRKKYWGYAPQENLTVNEILKGSYQGIRPAWGYPMLPDQTMIKTLETLLPFKTIDIEITENGAMAPSSSVCGLYIANPNAKYFMIGEIGEDQIKRYAKDRHISETRVKEILRQG